MASSALHVGEDYHEFIMNSPRDRRIRARFQSWVEAALPKGAKILDFGAGTGIDACHYAALGHKVWVFEPDPSMLAYLKQHCAEQIKTGKILPNDIPADGQYNVVTANFAVFNLVDSIEGAIKSFNNNDKLIVELCLLNPLFFGDMKYPWWWKNLWNLIFKGRYTIFGTHGNVHRFTLRALSREVKPWFHITRAHPTLLGHLFEPFIFVELQRRT